ncbi:MAG TPA: sigma-70 family RNA polymerase sigma factor [Polyangiaceae bacterium]|nr:sigma-70 family RNA polymerase sigma factor [Polyangiaceae bacterium]
MGTPIDVIATLTVLLTAGALVCLLLLLTAYDDLRITSSGGTSLLKSFEPPAAQMSKPDPPSMEEIHALTPYIHSVLKARGVPERDRCDLVQRVLIGAWRAIASSRYEPKPGVPLRAWVGEIARRQASTYRRSAMARREQLTAPDEIRHESRQPPPDDMLAEEEERHLMTTQLKSADPMQQILFAHDVEGVPMAEIAKEQRVPLSTAYRWRASALSALQKEARRRV